MKEKLISSAAGIPVLIALLALLLIELFTLINGARMGSPLIAIGSIVALIVTAICLGGFYMVEPNQAAVLSLFGAYRGTVKEQGLRWNNPFYSTKKVSLRVRNFESGKLKVNELEGSPIEIAAVIVWKVVDSAEAVFNVDDYESFVHVQSESALRAMASSYPYDQHEEGQISLRSHPTEISAHLKEQLDERLTTAGIDVLEARISHLAYAPEIAHAMLQRQQANAVIAARTRIVEGAVSMVEMALDKLKAGGVVDLDEERRAQMVSNLLVVLCSDRATTPVVNTGSMY
ncbi:SPFH domain-containing protein [Pseudoxanthomonas sp. CAU 1598]|uniref:SPFH domain-containing protein n=1 Tax=Pseudomarimonas arenosa TaxID=2774145 RepID=A0AAW3ZPF7_9GAMM|nr:SPFH domain-containing protein [Pseudomarimonas arenosa]MBD8526982.1 SPFH domain-containing protein [Pseudomarimonas arenosa]